MTASILRVSLTQQNTLDWSFENHLTGRKKKNIFSTFLSILNILIFNRNICSWDHLECVEIHFPSYWEAKGVIFSTDQCTFHIILGGLMIFASYINRISKILCSYLVFRNFTVFGKIFSHFCIVLQIT